MHSLFLKVFLWFWLATALVIGALLLTTELTRERQQFPVYTGMDKAMNAVARVTVETFEREGREATRKLFGDAGGTPNATFYLFDESGAELTGHVAPPRAAQETARRATATERIVRGAPGERMFVAHPVTSASGRRYVFVDAIEPRNRFPDNPLVQALRILAALLTAGALCYLLARYIVSPVVKLRAVTGQVARGDLSARVSPLLGKRRDELAEMGRDFDAMTARIESLVSAQHRLIRDISHELRSPLTRLGVALELARRRAGAEAGGALDRIGREAESINEMIGQLLTLSRFESNAGGSGDAEIDLSALVREIADDADFEARSRNRQARMTACEACTTKGVPGLVRSAIENVVRNAVRHTAEGTAVEIALTCEVVNNRREALIRVRDHGAGVPEAALDKIFQPFYRVEEARDRQTGGSGLGLAIAARAMRLHEGRITATNAADGGLSVEMRLPATDSAQ
ncbi:MAG TPA: ATP-binding protein [Pyrinomonadaceae bacterium]|jgi:two-component system sensor histidine kinase CpxA|nr:ATP-binding protein [Pyrinomonadaceae bacterium]